MFKKLFIPVLTVIVIVVSSIFVFSLNDVEFIIVMMSQLLFCSSMMILNHKINVESDD